MNDKKQIIEEIAVMLCGEHGNTCSKCKGHEVCLQEDLAIKIYNKFFRKPSEGKWISVKERLPDEGVTVIVALKIGDRIVSDTDRLYCGRWFIYGRMNREGYVTHWMPFPEPPKGE